jgi:ABC-type antimicrobial peptide transport system permease subunit
MGAIGVRLRSELRASWRSWAALAVLIGLFGGIVLGVAAGARRTATAFPHLVEKSRASDALIGAFKNGAGGYYRAVGHDPSVLDYGLIAGMPVFPFEHGEVGAFNGNAIAPIDGKFGATIDRPLVLAGRLPRPDAPREVFVNEVSAQTRRLRVGSRIRVAAASFADESDEPTDVRPFTVTVVGIGRFNNEVVPTTKFDQFETILMSPAAFRTYVPNGQINFDGIFVRLRPGEDESAYRRRVKAYAAAHSEEVGGDILYADYRDRNERVERTIRPQAVALGLFAAFAGLAGFLVVGQALSRQLSDDATEIPILRVLGLTRGQLVRLALLRTGLVVGVAALIAVGVAVGISPLFPIGAARRALVTPGADVNLALLGAGAAVILVVFLARAAVPAWRLARVPAGIGGTAASAGDRPSPTAARLGSLLPASAGTGVRMALEPGRGRSAVPVRTTLVGAIVALAAVATTATFAVNLNRLVSTPRLYGRSWDVMFDGDFGPIPRQGVEPILRRSKIVASWSGGFYGEASVAGTAVTAIGIHGPVHPVVVSGRPPARGNEVVLGTSTLRQAHRSVGDTVSVDLGDGPEPMKVVGRAVFPAIGRGSFPQTGLGEGLYVIDRVLEPRDESLQGLSFFNFFLVRLRSGATVAQERTLISRLEKHCPPQQDCQVRTTREEFSAERPAEITNLDRIRWTPVVLAGLLAGLAVATVAHTLLTSIRRRRRDLALLKTIGFQRGQISAVVAWQATTFATAALIGLPLGLALGRVLWRALANEMGIVPDVATPALALLLAIPATIVVANLLAVVPGWLAGRIRPAVALHAE